MGHTKLIDSIIDAMDEHPPEAGKDLRILLSPLTLVKLESRIPGSRTPCGRVLGLDYEVCLLEGWKLVSVLGEN